MAVLLAVALALLLLGSGAGAQHAAPVGSDAIRLNQLGFHPRGRKVAAVVSGRATRFAVLAADGGDTVLTGRLAPPRRWAPSGEVVRLADFSALTRPGRYRLAVAGVGRSHPFDVAPAVAGGLAGAALKAFYFQRASVALPPTFAGRWSRPAGHPDTAVLVHPSAAGPGRPSGTRLAAAGGWYDAGDYNKYVVNSGISTYTLLLLAEHFPSSGAAGAAALPESGNALPDALDEALWNLRWMRAMQDPRDGGVYHKLTNAEFDGLDVPPHRAIAPRYVVQKSTAAALDFAAVAAHAAVVVRRFPRALPGLADSLVREATAAWGWASAHPAAVYDQDALNARFTPRVSTGAYGDRDLDDELAWAAAELHLATRDRRFLAAAAPLVAPAATVPDWSSVRTLGLYSLVDRRRELPADFDTTALKARLLALADSLAAEQRRSAYAVPIGAAGDFVWGSNAVAANQGMALVQAYRASGDSTYLVAAAAALDYLLGRNATGYSFVTGYGARPPRRPHHRLAVADTVAAPIPGFLVGGPNPARQDRCKGYPSTLPARAYVDDACSYASNEVAINWNAPLAYLAAAVHAIHAERAGGAGAGCVSVRRTRGYGECSVTAGSTRAARRAGR